MGVLMAAYFDVPNQTIFNHQPLGSLTRGFDALVVNALAGELDLNNVFGETAQCFNVPLDVVICRKE